MFSCSIEVLSTAIRRMAQVKICEQCWGITALGTVASLWIELQRIASSFDGLVTKRLNRCLNSKRIWWSTKLIECRNTRVSLPNAGQAKGRSVIKSAKTLKVERDDCGDRNLIISIKVSLASRLWKNPSDTTDSNNTYTKSWICTSWRLRRNSLIRANWMS